MFTYTYLFLVYFAGKARNVDCNNAGVNIFSDMCRFYCLGIPFSRLYLYPTHLLSKINNSVSIFTASSKVLLISTQTKIEYQYVQRWCSGIVLALRACSTEIDSWWSSIFFFSCFVKILTGTCLCRNCMIFFC